MTLEEAIRQLVSLGERDPLEIARKLERQHGAEWLREQASLFAEELVTTFARAMLGTNRRSAEIALRPGGTVETAEMKVAKLWIPGEGWKQFGECTAADLLARERLYSTIESAARRRRLWLEQIRLLMEAEGAATVGDLRSEFPPLPSDDTADLAELVAA